MLHPPIVIVQGTSYAAASPQPCTSGSLGRLAQAGIVSRELCINNVGRLEICFHLAVGCRYTSEIANWSSENRNHDLELGSKMVENTFVFAVAPNRNIRMYGILTPFFRGTVRRVVVCTRCCTTWILRIEQQKEYVRHWYAWVLSSSTNFIDVIL